jgi:hypothetical protein
MLDLFAGAMMWHLSQPILIGPDIIGLYTPTMARVVPMKIKRWSGFPAANIYQSSACIQLNCQTPCPPRGAVPVNQHGFGVLSSRHAVHL